VYGSHIIPHIVKFLSSPERHEGVLEKRRYSSTHSLTSALDGSGQINAPAVLSPWKEPLVPTGQEAWWVPEPFWTGEIIKYKIVPMPN
jgi:hypothetical protein